MQSASEFERKVLEKVHAGSFPVCSCHFSYTVENLVFIIVFFKLQIIVIGKTEPKL